MVFTMGCRGISAPAKQPQFPQLLLIRLVVQILHQLRCPSLDTLQNLNVFLIARGPKLHTGFKSLKQTDTLTQLGVVCKLTEDALDPLVQIIERPAFLYSFALQDCFPRDSVNQAPKQAKVCPPEVQGGSSADFFFLLTSPRIENYHFVIAMPKTAFNCHITHKSFSVCKQQVQRSVFPSWLTHQLCQEVICHTFQEPPRLFPLCCIVFPADIWDTRFYVYHYLQGWRLNHFPGQPVPRLDNPLSEEKFPNIQSKPPLEQLEAISSRPITCYLGEETDPHLSTTSFQIVEESNKVSPQPPFLQAEQPQFPQPLLIRLLRQTLHQLRCPSLDMLQHLNIPLVVGGPKLNTGFEGWRLNHFPGQPVPMLDNPLGKEKFPNIQSKPPLAQLEAISSRPITCYLGEETDPHLSTTSFQLRCPSLDTLQYLNIPLVVGGPKLNTGFKVRPHQCRVQGHNHFPSPAGHTIFDTSQDAIGFLGRLGTLLAHIQAAVNKHPQVLLCQAAFQPLFPKPVALHGVAVAQVQDLALGLVKTHTVVLGPSIQPVQVPLQSLPTLQQINTPTQLGIICKLTEGALDPFVQIIDKDVKQNWPQHRALGNTACDRPPTGVNSIHHHSLGPAVQPVLYPAKSTPTKP
ncbi:hypothetical protein QYF61_011825 [Mycteria americana]|uniref:Uncharacterized protein n=1 Tax=Mycteria americana TaxID=33587 RepID=A0AAN7PH40_MYCAM|nr:hypothetical protein QYF61_011825 [Mycteria americana]